MASDNVTVGFSAVPGSDRADDAAVRPCDGLEPRALTDEELLRELASVHRTRHDTFRHGSDSALAHHDRRTAELEREYIRRFPEREVDPRRVR
jgi:hypothetical protein